MPGWSLVDSVMSASQFQRLQAQAVRGTAVRDSLRSVA